MDKIETEKEKKRFEKLAKEANAFFLDNALGGFDPGAMSRLMYYTAAKDIFMMQNSVVIKDQSIFDIAESFDGSLALSQGFFHFLGKYRREIIEQVGLPIPHNKKAAVFWEYYWSLVYADAETKIAMCEHPLEDTEVFEKKYGRINMVLENEYIKKYKSDWGQKDDSQYVNISPEQLKAMRVPRTMSWKPKS